MMVQALGKLMGGEGEIAGGIDLLGGGGEGDVVPGRSPQVTIVLDAKGAGSFHDIRKSMKKLCANDTSRYPKVLKIGPNHGCQ